MNYLVLHVRDYDFEDDSGGRVQGATISYLDLSAPAEQGELGFPPLQLSTSREVGRQFSDAPGFYDMNFVQKRGKGGKARLVLTGAKFLSSLPLQDVN